MPAERNCHLETLLCAAIEINNAAEREVFLDGACGADDELRGQVARLVADHFRAGGFLNFQVPALSETMALPTLEQAGSRIGNYKLLEQIGEGGMGSVFMAEQSIPVHRQVALKIIKACMDTRQVIARFEAERQALAMMDHPNIAKVFDAGSTNSGRPYFVMELVKGIPITKYCDEKRLKIRERLELMIPVCHAIQHAHQKGIIHRDIKPSNVLVAQYDGRPVPKVIDFGVSKATAQKLTEKTMFTEHGQIVGTLEYMSPEQAEPNQLDIDTRSDVYSLGVLLYELLTGTTPLDGTKLRSAAFGEMLRMIREDEPLRPSNRLSTIETLASVAANRRLEPGKLSGLMRGELDWIVMMALEKARDDRYESANAFAADIQRLLAEEQVLACPPSIKYRLSKFARKHKAILMTALLVTVSLLLGTVLSIWQAVRATKAEKQATEAANQSKSVLDFYQQAVLEAARPEDFEGGLGKDVTLRQAIDAAESKIAIAFTNQPLIEASVRNELGNTYRHLGESKKAIVEHLRALDLRSAHLEPQNLDTLDSRLNLASDYRDAGQLDLALQLSEETLRLARAKLGNEHSFTLACMSQLGLVYSDSGRMDAATELHESALKIATDTLGLDDPVTLRSMNNLAGVYRETNKLGQAISLYEKVYAIAKRRLGENHPNILLITAGLGAAYWQAHDPVKALPLLKKTLEPQTAKLGRDHPTTLRTITALANAHFFNDVDSNVNEALSLYQEAYDLGRAKQGPDHPDSLSRMDNLAHVLRSAQKKDESLAVFREMYSLMTDKLGAENPDTKECKFQLALAYRSAEQLDQAIPLFQEIYQSRKSELGPTDEATLSILRDLADTLNTAREFVKAESLYRELVVSLKMVGPTLLKTNLAILALGRNLYMQEKYAEAEPFLLAGYEGLKANQEPGRDRRMAQAMRRLVEFYTAWQKPDEAAKWQNELEKLSPTSNSQESTP